MHVGARGLAARAYVAARPSWLRHVAHAGASPPVRFTLHLALILLNFSQVVEVKIKAFN